MDDDDGESENDKAKPEEVGRSNQYHNGAGTMQSGASHRLRRTLAYLGGSPLRQNAIRTPPKCLPTLGGGSTGGGESGKVLRQAMAVSS